MRINKLLFLLGILFVVHTSEAQRLEVGVMMGATNYQGDLTPGTARISFGNPHPAFGVHLGYEINDIITVRGKVTLTAMSGFDDQARAPWRLQRNLHFRSSLQEAGINVEIYGLNVFKFMSNLAFHPYVVTGFNVFRFNPKAEYNGVWVPLQPLGTEGQGTPEFPDRKKYNLTEFSVPMGFGMRYTINNYISISADLTQRWTFTDYLDDVSKTYVPLDVLLSSPTNGELAANLTYRGGERGFDRVVTADDDRGNSSENDWYVITNVTMIFKLAPIIDHMSMKKAKCPKNF